MNASTVASNTAGTSIGVFLQSAAVGRFVHASVVSNTAPAGAGIAFNGAGPHFFTSTLLGGAVTDQCAGTSTKRNFSILATDADCGLRTVSSVAVGPLGAYGGDLPICVSTALTQ